ncbi:MAG TPA: cation:proton antiporter [Actinocrinis sp.]|uniref:cation:proton antiporter n=1 Tax=Actinocrinis sp. TaxID=1920516 RepID=UPI002D230390|nr:cation:proton antiporter [Actinocrinis sp.]HZU55522.1 cation:proton antiporter [Actinocrinis sp.]
MPPVTSPPLGGHSLLIFLVGAVALLGTALLLGRLAERLKLPAVAGELCAGILLGPSALGRIAPGLFRWLHTSTAAQMHLLDAIGQIGVILLVGVTALEIDLGLVRRTARVSLGVGALGLFIPLAFGVAAGFAAPPILRPAGREPALFALFVGVAMGVSALPVIGKMLSDMRLLHRDVGQLTVATGVVDDIVGWMLLSVVAAAAAGTLGPAAVLKPVCWLVVIAALAALVGRPAARALVDRTSSPQGAAGVAVVLILGCATATQAAGLEASFGALLGGLLVGGCRGATAAKLAPLRCVTLSVLAPLYFAEAGLRMDLGVLARPAIALAAAAALAAATLGKFAGAFLGARLVGLDRRAAMVLGAGLNARGVIQIIVAGVGLQLGVLNTAAYTVLVMIAIATSLMAPPVLRRAVARIEVTEQERVRGERAGQLIGVP